MNLVTLLKKKKELEVNIKEGDKNNISSLQLQAFENELSIIEEQIFKVEKLLSFNIGSRFVDASIQDFENSDIISIIKDKRINLFDYCYEYISNLKFLEQS